MKASAQPVLSEPVSRILIQRAPERVRRQAAVVALGPGASAIFTDGPAPRPGTRARTRVEVEGKPLPRPLVASNLPLLCGGLRRLVLVAESAPSLCQRRLTLLADGQPTALLEQDWLQSPLRALPELVTGLAPAARQRLAKVLLTAALPLFAHPDTLATILAQLGSVTLSARSWRRMGKHAGLFSIPLPAGTVADLRTLVLLSDGVRPLPALPTHLECGDDGNVLHICLPDRLPDGATLAALGPGPFTVETAGLRARPIVPWIKTRSPQLRAWLDGRLKDLEAGDAVAASIRAELRGGAQPAPAARLRHIERTRSGILLFAESEAPVAARLRVTIGSVFEELEIDPAQRIFCGHFGFPGLIPADAPCRVALIRSSGRATLLHDGLVARGNGTIHPDYAELPHALAAPAIARARKDLEWAPARSRIETFGSLSRRPSLSVVTPLGSDPDRLRALLAFTFAEPRHARVETVIVAPEGRPAEQAARLLAECDRIFGLSLRLVATDARMAPAASLGEGFRAIRSERALLLGSDTLPAGPGWLLRWSRALRPQTSAPLGATLVAPDGTILHAGGCLDHPRDGIARLRAGGLPRCELPPQRRARTALVTASCAGLGRAAIEAYLGLVEQYPDPDVLLSMLASSSLSAATLLDTQAVRYSASPDADALRDAVDAVALSALLQSPCEAGA